MSLSATARWFQCLITFSMKKLFFTSNLKLHQCNLRPFPPSCHLSPEKRGWHPSCCCFQVTVESNEISLSLLFPTLNNQLPQLFLMFCFLKQDTLLFSTCHLLSHALVTKKGCALCSNLERSVCAVAQTYVDWVS